MKRRVSNRLFYVTVEDESLLAETFPRLDEDSYAIAYKVSGTEDVFITTRETKEAMDRTDVPYNLLAEEDGSRIGLHHTALSAEELADYEDALTALALAYRAVGMICVGVNGDNVDLSDGAKKYTYFTAPAGHTFLWRLFPTRDEALVFVAVRFPNDPAAQEWAETLTLEDGAELKGFH
ncbi:MAG: hypothetical protein AAF772_07135 [Acidobacteriota bacterium]